MINAGLPMATPDMAQLSGTIGSIPADPQETALRQYIQQLEAQGMAGTPQYLIAGGELQNRQNMREEAMAQQAAGVQQQPPVMQQLSQQPQQPQQLGYQPQQQGTAIPNVAQQMQNQLGATPSVPQGLMYAGQSGGIETLPAENLNNIENYAGGGIVAFDEGGEVPAYGLGGTVKRILAAQPEQDTASQADLKQRLRGLYDQGQTTLPNNFFTSEEGGGIRGKIRNFLTNTLKKDLAQKELDSMWADKNKADIAAYFSGPGNSIPRLSEEDVKKYGLAGGGMVAFDEGGPTSEIDFMNIAPYGGEPYVRPRPTVFPPELIGKVGLAQIKDIESGLYGSTPEEILRNFGGVKAAAPVKKTAATETSAPAAPAAPAEARTKPSAAAPDATMTGLAALNKALTKEDTLPTLTGIANERKDYYRTLGIPEDPYAKIIERAQKAASPEQAKKDKDRLIWETMLGIGSNLATAPSKQRNKRAQFFEDVAFGIKKGTEKLPEGLRELDKLKRERDKALEDADLAKVNYLRTGADADLKRFDDKQLRAENKNFKLLELRTSLSIEQAKASGLKDYRATEQDNTLWAAAQKAAADFYSKDPKALTNPELVLPKIRSLAVQFYNDSKTRGAGGTASSVDTSKWGDPKVKKP